jgi:hypothetical protein
MKIEDRIAITQEQVRNVLAFIESELESRIVYLHRARVLIEIIASTLGAMTELERKAVPSDFEENWRSLRSSLEHAQGRFQAIVAGSDAPQQPCKTNV